MAILGFELDEIARLLALAEANGLDEFVFEEDGRFLRIRDLKPRKLAAPARSAAPTGETAPAAIAPRRKAAPKAIAPANDPNALTDEQLALVSPMMGVFYRSDKPGSPPFLSVGDRVRIGQTIGLIEAMKIFSEVPAEQEGVVVALTADDGQLVQAGTPLVILRRDG